VQTAKCAAVIRLEISDYLVKMVLCFVL